jgi:replicative DNA helicase
VETVADSFIPPQAETSEIQVLGSIIQEGKLIEKADLYPGDFYHSNHQTIFTVMKDIHRRGVRIDISELFDEIRKSENDEITGGSSYLTYLVEITPSTVNFAYHVRKVKETSIKRRFVEEMYANMQLACKDGPLEDLQAGIMRLREILSAITERPDIRQEAFYGLSGEILNLIYPYSEADPIALLANFLTVLAT